MNVVLNWAQVPAIRLEGNPAPALVPAEPSEVVGLRELVPREDGSVLADQRVIEDARIADPDPALHEPLEGCLARDPPLQAEVDDRLHHRLRPARHDGVERVLV